MPKSTCPAGTICLQSDHRRVYEPYGRRIEFVACTPNPTGAWVSQQARNLLMTLDDREPPLRFLIHDRDAKFTGGCDHVLQSQGIAVIRNARPGTERERSRRALGRQRPSRVPRLAADPQPPPARARASRLCRPLRMEVKLLDVRRLLCESDVGAGDRELKRRRWGCLLPRCLAA